MKLGFTGTRAGMKPKQAATFSSWINKHKAAIAEFHHGDCVGSDVEAAERVALQTKAAIHTRPGKVDAMRAHFDHPRATIYPAKDFMARNRDIVDATDVLLATPAELAETLRGGTWSTIRYARKSGKRVVIVNINGEINDSK